MLEQQKCYNAIIKLTIDKKMKEQLYTTTIKPKGTVEAIRKWFMKKGKATNREVIHKFDYLHGISDVVFIMKKNGHNVETERVNLPNRKHYTIYHYKGRK